MLTAIAPPITAQEAPVSMSAVPAFDPTQIPRLTHEALRARLGEDSIVLVDALAPESYASGHIPGAVSLPLADVPERAANVLPDRGAAIAVYCASFT